MANFKPEWMNAHIFEINKQPQRCTSTPYGSVADALGAQTSPFEINLDGAWRFHWVPRPAEREVDFYRQDFDDSKWGILPVPSQWELQGFGVPIYAPFHMPPSLRKRHQPNIDVNDNPVGAYRLNFQIPTGWQGRAINLQFGGVCSAFYVWINGEFVGYSQDSMLPAEFEITSYLKEGSNLLAVEVYRFSDGSYLENQDMWFLSGIFRSVRLVALPACAIRDFHLGSLIENDWGSAALQVDAEVRTHSRLIESREDLLLEVQLLASGRLLASQQIQISPQKGDVQVQIVLPSVPVKLWSAETPVLYDVVLVLRSESGDILDVRHARHGFRKVEIRERQLWVNGQSIKIHGVNRHDFDPDSGHTMSLERLKEDVLIMKRNNINAVRCSHYPDDERFYDFCDQYGLYVMDEANIETHGLRDAMRGDLQWEPAMRARVAGMLARDWNHPSIIVWSLGNESSTDERFARLTDLVHKLDPQRPVHYEQDYRGEYADFYSMMYATPDDLEAIANGQDYKIRASPIKWITIRGKDANQKPLILCEYAHAMGNSLGNFEQYIRIFEKYPHCIGGFIWDFADQGIRALKPDGSEWWAYGGDLGDPYDFKTFCCNGILAADRSPHPALSTVKKGYQDVEIKGKDLSLGQIVIHNKFRFLNMESFDLYWQMERDGMVVEQGQMQLSSTLPLQSTEVTIPHAQALPLEEYWLTVSIRLQTECAWAPAGHEIAWEQFRIPACENRLKEKPPIQSGMLECIHSGDEIRIGAADWQAVFDRKTGALRQYLLGDCALMQAPLIPNLWRAQIDNDISAGFLYPWGRWLINRQYWRKSNRTLQGSGLSIISQSESEIRLATGWRIPGNSQPFQVTYMINGEGEILVECSFQPQRDLERMGMQLALDGKDWDVTWFGLGPQETMPDRLMGARVGRFECSVSELMHDYIRPQENGNRSDVRWLEMLRGDGKGLRVDTAGDHHFCFSAWHCSQDDLADANHIHELPVRDFVTLNIDLKQKGVGGDVPAGGSPHPEFILHKGTVFQYSFMLKGIGRESGEAGL